jgi:hypothetical protein
MSLLTGAKKVFSPSSVVEYARFPAKTWGDKTGEGKKDRKKKNLESRNFDLFLRNGRRAVLGDWGGRGVRHDER